MSKKLSIKSLKRYAIGRYYDGKARFVTNVDGKLKFGIIDENKTIIVPPIFDNVEVWCNRIRINNKYGIINEKGQIIISPVYDFIQYEGGELGLFRVCKNGKSGFIDKNEKVVIPIIYNEVGGPANFIPHLIAVCKRNKWGFIDKKGKIIIPLKYDDVDGFWDNNFSIVRLKNKYGVIDKKGKYIIPLKYESIIHVSSGFNVTINQKSGFINSKNKIIIPCIYDHLEYSMDNLVIVKLKNKYGLFEKNTGNELLPIVYKSISFIDMYNRDKDKRDNKVRIEKNGKIGIAVREGNLFIPQPLEKVENISKNKLKKYYSKDFIYKQKSIAKLKNKLPKRYRNYEIKDIYSKNLFEIVNNKRQKGLVNKNGNIILKPGFDFITLIDGVGIASKYCVTKKGYTFKSFLLLKNKLVKKYFDGLEFDNGLISASKDGKEGYIDYQGREVFES